MPKHTHLKDLIRTWRDIIAVYRTYVKAMWVCSYVNEPLLYKIEVISSVVQIVFYQSIVYNQFYYYIWCCNVAYSKQLRDILNWSYRKSPLLKTSRCTSSSIRFFGYLGFEINLLDNSKPLSDIIL